MRFWLLALVLSGLSAVVQAESFVVADIRLEGLQRVSAGTVFEAFPVSTGERVDNERLASASRRLFRSGLFDDIRLLRDGDVLVVQVVELPTITGIEISGNKAIQTDILLDGLKQSGLAEGWYSNAPRWSGLRWSWNASMCHRAATMPALPPTWNVCRATG